MQNEEMLKCHLGLTPDGDRRSLLYDLLLLHHLFYKCHSRMILKR